jgi:hypothetical protein
MTAERRPEDEQGGFETSSELRRDYPSPAPSAPSPGDVQSTGSVPYGPGRSRRGIWLLALAVVVVGLAVYLLVTFL